MDASIAIPLANRKLVWVAGLIAAAFGAIGYPMVGVPLALGIGAYATIRLSKPHRIIRGRTLSPRQQQQTAVIAAGAMLAIAGLSSATMTALDLAHALEHRLHDALATAHSRGELQLGEILHECRSLACANATVTKLATPATVGIAKLGGFAWHEQIIYHRHSSGSVGPERNTAQR